LAGGLGLGQYAQLFADNGIDLSVLPDLTDQDLKRPRQLTLESRGGFWHDDCTLPLLPASQPGSRDQAPTMRGKNVTISFAVASWRNLSARVSIATS
jgi:SAM domain (Sterile alpha motif)